MKLEVKNESENKLLHRKELDVSLKELDATPSRKEIVSFLAANLGVPEANIVVEEIRQEYGVREVDCYVKIYESEALKNEIEPKQKATKEPEKEEAQEKKEEKPAEAKEAQQEKPAEEKKGEAPAEKPAEGESK